MSTLRISNIEAKSVPASATIDEKVKITNSSGDTLVFLDGKTSGITTVGINTTDGNITFDANSNVVVTGIITATRFSGQITPTSLEIGSNIKLGNAGVITATSFVGSGANLTSLPTQVTLSNNADNRIITGGSGVNLNGESNFTFDGGVCNLTGTGDGVLNLNTTNSAGAFIRFRQGGTNKVFVGCGQGLGAGSATDLGLVSDSGNIICRTNSNERLRITSDGKIGFHAASPITRFQVGNATFNGGHGMYSNDRVGMANHGSLTGLMLASTYNDAGVPEYGLVFVQGPTTSNYNCWSISPDGLSLIHI